MCSVQVIQSLADSSTSCLNKHYTSIVHYFNKYQLNIFCEVYMTRIHAPSTLLLHPTAGWSQCCSSQGIKPHAQHSRETFASYTKQPMEATGEGVGISCRNWVVQIKPNYLAYIAFTYYIPPIILNSFTKSTQKWNRLKVINFEQNYQFNKCYDMMATDQYGGSTCIWCLTFHT